MEWYLILLNKILRFLAYFKHFISYAIFLSFFHLLSFTLITYFLIPSQPTFQEINDLYFSNQIIFLGLGSFFYIFGLLALNPLAKTTFGEFISIQKLKKKLLPGFTRGLLISSFVLILFHLSSHFEFLGFYVQLEELHLWVFNFFIKAICLILLVFSEEFIFRQKILNSLKQILSPFFSAFITTLLYVLIKMAQFDLDVMQLSTLFIISLSLSLFSTIEGDFTKGAGILIGLYLSFHSIFSLPILGNESQGLFISRYVPFTSITTSDSHSEVKTSNLDNDQLNIGNNQSKKENFLKSFNSNEKVHETVQLYLKNMTWNRFIYGGKSGPLSSFILQTFFMFFLLQIILRFRNIWFQPFRK